MIRLFVRNVCVGAATALGALLVTQFVQSTQAFGFRGALNITVYRTREILVPVYKKAKSTANRIFSWLSKKLG